MRVLPYLVLFWFPVTIFQVEPFYNGYSVYRWLFQPIYPLIFTLIFLIIPVSCNKPYEMCLIGKVNKITGFPTFVALAARALSLLCRSTLTFFLLTRTALMEQGEHLQQSAKLLGANQWRILYKVTLPLIRPAIAVGCALVAMETLGDFGTVAFFRHSLADYRNL
ncbi:ABC transporter permease subunit [Gallibacterium anatis]|uniref:ABC transporter permease subunit n=1 Tax=Gallibacterium anatis TaxID=750 RepID=UPI0034605C93